MVTAACKLYTLQQCFFLFHILENVKSYTTIYDGVAKHFYIHPYLLFFILIEHSHNIMSLPCPISITIHVMKSILFNQHFMKFQNFSKCFQIHFHIISYFVMPDILEYF